MTQQNSLVISIVMAAVIIGGSLVYTGKNSTSATTPTANAVTLYPTPLPQVAQLPPVGAGCGIPR